MRNIAIVLAATFLLSGCALIAEGVALEGAEVGAIGEGSMAAGGLGEASAAAGAGGEITAVSVSTDLAGIAEEQGVISRWLQQFAESGRTASLDGTGLLRANNTSLGRFEADGRFMAATGRYAGYLSSSDGILYENAANGMSQPVATLEGFIPENGVRLATNLDGSTSFDVLRPNVMVRVLGVENGFYRVLLPNGTIGEIPATAAALTVLALTQASSQCPDDRPGAAVLKSGEEIAFDQCKQLDGAFMLHTPTGNVVVDGSDLDRILTGDKIPNAPLYASNALDGLGTPATNASGDAVTADTASDAGGDNQSTNSTNSDSSDNDSAENDGPATAQSGTVFVLAAQTYLWPQPDSRYRPINTLYAGVKFELVGEAQNGWQQVWILDRSGTSQEVNGYIPVESLRVAQN